MMSDETEFVCISCNKTLKELRELSDGEPQLHTNYGSKKDALELCHGCWVRTKRSASKTPKNKPQFQCKCCKRTEEELKQLSKISKYYGLHRRLPGDSRFKPAQYCGPCAAKLKNHPSLCEILKAMDY